ncbi:MAG: TonB-dependent receptor [Melioribacteraceae bacterium]|nr:TonB-dependent receptor [Melioribacteraceae bacterium]MCF8354223.1 TonB-dependent receptor [Melioribacteraceae bacterium]MCF8392869.1 TonB-dependent receptor [Melioribacteraceae bacterium]MCF8418645.1 TonB-dependent receptor [Melioribacteraceae bacterium]
MKRFFLIIVLVLIGLNLYAQTGSLKGYVYDESNNEPIAGVNISIQNSDYAATTNQNGFYSFNNLQSKQYDVVMSHIGYQVKIFRIDLETNQKIVKDIHLIPTPINLGEITVTSTFKDILLRDEPMSVEVVTSDQILFDNNITISDAMKNEPGVSVTRDGLWTTDVAIRGLSKFNVVTLIDGNRIETSTAHAARLSLIDVNDIERIEVIKGGASALYGSGAMGGVLNVITKSGYYSEGFNVGGSFTSGYNTVNKGSLGNVSINASDDRWYAKFSGTMRNASDAETPSGKLNSRFRDNNINASIGVRPTGSHELIFNYQKFDANDVGIPGGTPFPSAATARYISSSRELLSGEYRIKNLMPSLLSFSFKFYHQKIIRDLELIPNANAIINPGAKHVMNGLQIQTKFLINKSNLLIAGIDSWQRSYDGYRYKHVIPANQTVFEKPLPNSKFRSVGIYGQNEIQLMGKKIKLSLGGRFDFIKITNDEVNNPIRITTNGVINNTPPVNEIGSFEKNNVNNYSWSGNIGLLYKFNENFNTSLNYSHSFRSPNLEERYQYIELLGNTYLGNPELEPEIGDLFDLGFRYYGKKISFRISAFYNFLNNLMIDRFDYADNVYRKQNVGSAELYGFEFSIDYNIWGSLVTYANAAYVNGKDKETEGYLPEIPPLNGVLGLKGSLLKLVRMDFYVKAADNQSRTASDETETPGFAFYNFTISSMPIDIFMAKLSIIGGVENLFNKSYRNHLSTYRGLIVNEPGRNFYIKLNLTW